jgi:glycosyltransferase involved in cell wall biosynthesis
VVVITASVGGAALRRCVTSVLQQDFPNVRHLVIVDGPEYAAAAAEALGDLGRKEQLETLVLPRNTGHSSHFGYRIYGAMPLLVDDDIVCYLDEDNWLDTEHIATAIESMRSTGADWAYSLRRICAEDGTQICDDDADSLGYWPKFATRLPDGWLASAEASMHARHPNLVDSSCYVLPRRLACSVAALWQALHADSVVPSVLVRRYSGVCTGRSTVNYVLGGGSATPADWFTDGNGWIRELYDSGVLPWRQTPRRLGPGSLTHPGSAPLAVD